MNRTARDDWRFPLDRPADFFPGARRFDGSGLIDRLRLVKADAAFAQLAAWEPHALAAHLAQRTAALREALHMHGVPVDIAGPAAPHVLGVRPGAAWGACIDALDAANIDVTARHGVLRIAPHLHVGLDDMRHVADVLARAMG